MLRSKLPGYMKINGSGLRKGKSSKYNMIDFAECIKDEMLLGNGHMFGESAINHYCPKHKKTG